MGPVDNDPESRFAGEPWFDSEMAAADEEAAEQHRPSIEELIERSSPGTPAARRLRASVLKDEGRRIAERAEQIRNAVHGVRFQGLAAGGPSPFDGMWLVEYDPGRPGVAPDGRPMLAHITATDDPAKAQRFTSIADFHDLWRATSGRTRPDGRPDRPLTAFDVEYVRLP